jgi:hypothetical protein
MRSTEPSSPHNSPRPRLASRQAHIFSGKHEDTDGRNESGHDERVVRASKS